MTADAQRRGWGAACRNFWSGISAVSIKELRGRMRGRRAFAVLTIYLLLLGLFSFGVYVYLKSQASQVTGFSTDFGGMPFPGTQTLGNGTALSAGIGHAIFGGLLFVETLLVLVLAPAFTTGAISLEREKQTLDMLITTPLSTLGMVIGKLFSALTYVFLLILASIPFASLVFVFGGVGPEDLLRAYAFLFALAFGMGAIGLFISAVVKRTQTATVVTFVVVLVISIGTAAAHEFWQVAGRQSSTGTGPVADPACQSGAGGGALAQPVRRQPRHGLRDGSGHLSRVVRLHQQRDRSAVLRLANHNHATRCHGAAYLQVPGWRRGPARRARTGRRP